MFNKKNCETAVNTIIGNGIRLESAMLTGQDTVKIEGKYIGDIDLNGKLIIGENGSVTGNIRAKLIEVAGKVTGNVYCGATVHLTATAQLEGSIGTRRLITEEGASFNGQCRMLSGQSGHTAERGVDADEDLVFDFEKLGNVLIPEYGPPVLPGDTQN